MENKLIFADLFAGCGGLSYGFHKNPYFQQKIAVDNWQPAQDVYKYNFPESDYLLADLGDSKQLDYLLDQLKEECDVLLGGPPCKGFSTLNNSKSESRHNTLVDSYLDVAESVRPKIVLMENVRSFASKTHPTGIKYNEHVKKRLQGFSPAYNVKELILNAKDFGVPQTRVRYFLIATRIDFDPSGSVLVNIIDELNNNIVKHHVTLREAIGDLPKVSVREGADYIRSSDGKEIYNHKSLNHSQELENRFMHVPPKGGLLDVPKHLLTEHLRKMVEGSYGSGGFIKNIYGRMEWDQPSGTIVAGIDKITCGRFLHPEENRLLTPRECARIQSFPDNFVFSGGLVTQYYLVGNAVPPVLSSVFANAIEIAVAKKNSSKKRNITQKQLTLWS